MNAEPDMEGVEQQLQEAYRQDWRVNQLAELRMATVRIITGFTVTDSGHTRRVSTWLLEDDGCIDSNSLHGDLDAAIEARFFHACDSCGEMFYRDQLQRWPRDWKSHGLICAKCLQVDAGSEA